MSGKNHYMKLWGMPVLITVISLGGLLAALVGDGAWDVLSWIALFFPLALAFKGLFLKRSDLH